LTFIFRDSKTGRPKILHRMIASIPWLQSALKTGHWRKMHNEEFHDLCCSLNVIRVIQSWRMRTEEKCIRDLVGKPEGITWKTWM
jgi:hypothetical protein